MAVDSPQLMQTLVESFNALADEVQSLIDRKLILESKLRWSCEQYQLLADKYAPAAPHIAETLAKLQLPPSPTLTSSNRVPLPRRHQSSSSQAELAVFIREGKKVARQLSMVTGASKESGSSRETTTSTNMTSQSTFLERDFTVEGKKGHLGCPFSAMNRDAAARDEVDDDEEHDANGIEKADPTPHHSKDPICAAMFEETMSAPAPNASASKCPIRYLDQHSPEEIARYVETHKHELPRSHEVCLKRNQKNEEQIRKLDAKYGNLVSMIQDLSHLHAPMLPESQAEAEAEAATGAGAGAERASNRRVSDWAQNVSSSTVDGLVDETVKDGEVPTAEDYLDRTGHFERPLKEIRVGESPSRPWGISVPFPRDEPVERPSSPPPAPVRMPSPSPASAPKASEARPSKCPFDHTKMKGLANAPYHNQIHKLDGPGLAEFPKMEETPSPPRPNAHKPAASQPFMTQMKHPQPSIPDSPPPSNQPAFLNTTGMAKTTATGGQAPQFVFNGPVFIGYPMEQAIQFMQHFQRPS
ncbi:hypothetical protein DHEL01_v200701 [Diaporthe helianthi]|uniref:Uncharacterized protein n=1 Tax=Diaporthe helianthi TaxID=158607 RepID=A0A2P5IEF4_DIAHE|nr:hypothetical protein DHEL01_v200701 [Diaporthe helianthi]